MRGEGEIAESIHQLFEASCRRYHLNEEHIHLSKSHFTRNIDQMEMF
jgi:hypothetical protein